MFEAIVTFVTFEKVDGEEDGTVITKVYRLEFESERDFGIWLESSSDAVVNKEFLRGY